LRYGFGVSLTKTAGVVNDLIALESVDSTNLELARRLAQGSLPNFSLVVASEQTAGMGRLGRSWVSEPGSSISASLYLKSSHTAELSWATLIAATAIRSAIAELVTDEVLVKWPNDVLVNDKKISGILAQIQPDGSLILGFGINLKAQSGAPETATALDLLGVEADFDSVLHAVVRNFRIRWAIFKQDPQVAITKARGELVQHSATLGRSVRAELPGGGEVYGIAHDIDREGRLVIHTPEPVVVSAADVWHLRN
jgi:BirA family transcriptional regulator, biotin operon repressor / biotin---[acetyl-CoA-carboxylase] ligase